MAFASVNPVQGPNNSSGSICVRMDTISAGFVAFLSGIKRTLLSPWASPGPQCHLSREGPFISESVHSHSVSTAILEGFYIRFIYFMHELSGWL